MIQYPVEFNSKTTAQNGMQSEWETESKYGTTPVSIPPEFMGPGGSLSPEDLFNHALANCFVATFKVYAENSKVTFEALEVDSRLVVDLDEQKRPVMKELYLKAKIISPSHSEKALMLADKAFRSGFILNSVKTKCHFDFQII